MSQEEQKPKIKRTLFRKIVNAFIGIAFFLVFLLLMITGFSQTKTFREYLREKVIAMVNEEINGNLNIEKIDGTILTSIFLTNTSLTLNNDTLFFAKQIELKTSPLQILLQKIYIKKFQINDAKIQMLQDSSGVWNYEKVVKPTPDDSTKSSFPFTIQLIDLALQNVTLIRQSFENIGSKREYSTLNFDDLQIDQFFLDASVFADIDNSNYLINLKEISFRPNLTRFKLRNISGEFSLNTEYLNISNFSFITDSSDIHLDARIDSLNLFDDVNLEDFKNYPIYVNLDAPSFNFADLSSFFESTEMLKGSPAFKFTAEGKFGDFKIAKAQIDFRNTHIELNGRLQNLNVPEKLYIKANMVDTDIDYHDINAFMPSLELPEYAKSYFTDINVSFEGLPTNFKSKLTGNIDEGNISLEAAMNLAKSPIVYDIKFETGDLNLFPVLNMQTKLNSSGYLKGRGTTPAELQSEFRFDASSSIFDDFHVDKFTISSKAADKIIKLDIEGAVAGAVALIIGEMDFQKDTIPVYSMVGNIDKIDLANFLKDPYYESDLNIYFGVEGKGIDLDEMNSSFSVGLDSSRFKSKIIAPSNIEISFVKDSSFRKVDLVSDFMDLNVKGDFSINKALELLTYEGKTLGGIIAEKIKELNPIAAVSKSPKAALIDYSIPEITKQDLEFSYTYKFKDFELISLLMGQKKIEIAGVGEGIISNHEGNFSIKNKTEFDYLIIERDNGTVYLSGIAADINLNRDNRYLSFDNLLGNVTLTGKRFYFGNNIKDISATFSFKDSKVEYTTSLEIENLLKTNLNGTITISPVEQQLLIKEINLTIDGLKFINKAPISALFNPYYFKIVDFKLYRDTSVIELKGIVETSGSLNLSLTADKISGDILGKYLFGFNDGQLIASGSLNTKITGDLTAPIINLETKIIDLIYADSPLGSLKGSLNYEDKLVKTQFTFLDADKKQSAELLTFDGIFPIDLSLGDVQKRMLDDKELSMRFKSTGFNLNALGNTLPFISKQNGILQADVKLSGTFNNPNYSGFIRLKETYFTLGFNNMEYKCRGSLKFAGNKIELDTLVVNNSESSKIRGELYGVGAATMDGMNIKDMTLKFLGELAVIGQQTKAVNPIFYGDLLLGTDGHLILTKNDDKYFFKGNVLLKRTDLIYTTGTENYSATSENFDFIFIEDSSKLDTELERFQKILAKEMEADKSSIEEVKQNFNLDYNVNIRAEDEAKITFILSQASLNQKLIVFLRGDLSYEFVNNKIFAQGGFELLPGSKLDFFKTFDATGSLRFESDITDPYLDILATYTSDYIDPRDEKAAAQDVAVKIKIRGPLSDLGKNLTNSQESIGVYVGTRNIQNNVRDQKYDFADAFSFILTGKFKDDLTAQDRAQVAGQTNAIGNTATSFLGSVLSNFVNSAVGDLVNNITINQSGEYTKFSLSGRVQNLRYSFGGTTEVFQNIGRANLKVEYLFNPRFLIRLERKDPLVNYNPDDKVTEMALKYRFEF